MGQREHINNFLTHAQSRANPANMFMSSAYSFPWTSQRKSQPRLHALLAQQRTCDMLLGIIYPSFQSGPDCAASWEAVIDGPPIFKSLLPVRTEQHWKTLLCSGVAGVDCATGEKALQWSYSLHHHALSCLKNCSPAAPSSMSPLLRACLCGLIRGLFGDCCGRRLSQWPQQVHNKIDPQCTKASHNNRIPTVSEHCLSLVGIPQWAAFPRSPLQSGVAWHLSLSLSISLCLLRQRSLIKGSKLWILKSSCSCILVFLLSRSFARNFSQPMLSKQPVSHCATCYTNQLCSRPPGLWYLPSDRIVKKSLHGLALVKRCVSEPRGNAFSSSSTTWSKTAYIWQ